MPQIIAEFDPSAKTSGSFALAYLNNGIGYLVVYNDSNWSLDLAFPNGDSDIAPAWLASIYRVTGPSADVTWTQDKQVNLTSPDLSNVWVIAYQEGEEIPGTFPAALTRQTKTGGGSVTNTDATQVSNTTFPGGTVFVFGAPVNDSDVRGATNVQNNGQIILGDNNYAGQFTLRTSTPATNVQNANQMILTDTLGTTTASLVGTNPPFLELLDDSAHSVILQTISPILDLSGVAAAAKSIITGNNRPIQIKDSGGTARDTLLVDGSNNTILQAAASGGNINLNDQNASTIAQFTSGSGLALLLGTIAVSQSTQVNGSAGSYTKAFPLWGAGGKLMIVTVGGYTNASTSTITFPSTMGRGIFFIFGLGGMSFTLSAGTVAVVLTLGTAAAAGTEAGASTVRGDSMGYIATGVSGIVLSTATTQNGCIVFVGN